MITCPTCGDKKKPTPTTEGTHTATCFKCHGQYSYVVKDGEVCRWEPARIAGLVVNGVGKPGGR